ncbi:hypothetical protein HY090_02345 [Candidatus Kaiserbacteria bacterium]|nr:hypothetical protein [Candidatus Kaiserbacteria bacterium]
MEPDTQMLVQKLSELEAKVDAIHTSVEKTRKYFLWTGIVTLALIIIPLLILPLVVPAFLQSVTIPAGY